MFLLLVISIANYLEVPERQAKLMNNLSQSIALCKEVVSINPSKRLVNRINEVPLSNAIRAGSNSKSL